MSSGQSALDVIVLRDVAARLEQSSMEPPRTEPLSAPFGTATTLNKKKSKWTGKIEMVLSGIGRMRDAAGHRSMPSTEPTLGSDYRMPIFKSKLAQALILPAIAQMAILGLSPQAHAADAVAIEDSETPSVQNFDEERMGGVRQKLHDWDVVIGPVVIYSPAFEGAKDMKIRPFPMFSATIGGIVSVDPRGVSVRAYETKGFTLDLKGGYELGRAEDDDDHLEGLGDVDVGGVIGATLGYQIGPAEIYASIDKTIGGSNGLTGTLGAKVSHRYERFLFSAGVSATAADDNHMETYFGVTPKQSTRSGLDAYEANAGIKRFDVEASVTYMVNENWLVRGQLGVGFLTGDAADSPIVQRKVQPNAMFLVGYKF
jgi:outer membrane protein